MTIEEIFAEGVIQAQFKNSIEDLNQELLSYGLSQNQARVYLFLSKVGTQSAPEISKSLKIARTETYQLLNILQQQGIIFSIIGKPTKFNAIEIEEALSILVENKKNRLDELESNKKKLIKMWKSVPKHSKIDEGDEYNKFQTLQGKNSILTKIGHMFKNTSKQIHVFGTENNFNRFYHSDLIDIINKNKNKMRILTTHTNSKNYIFKKIPEKRIKIIEDKNVKDYCFIIKDNNEVILFIDNTTNAKMIAIWTNSDSLVTAIKLLFALIWKKSGYINETELESILGNSTTFEHRTREMEQEKKILVYLQKNFNILKKKKIKT